MYRRFVEYRTKKLWEAVNRSDLDAVLAEFAPVFEYRSHAGDTPLSGVSRTREELANHLATVALALPSATYTVETVIASGWPQRTRTVTVVEVVAPLPDGSRYYNEIVQHVILRWGKVVEVTQLLDVQKREAALAVAGAEADHADDTGARATA
jgi:ketosteroid isomerase-like protein